VDLAPAATSTITLEIPVYPAMFSAASLNSNENFSATNPGVVNGDMLNFTNPTSNANLKRSILPTTPGSGPVGQTTFPSMNPPAVQAPPVQVNRVMGTNGVLVESRDRANPGVIIHRTFIAK
jgi:hypothetical protein